MKFLRDKKILLAVILAILALAIAYPGKKRPSEPEKPEEKISQESEAKQEVYSFRIKGFDKDGNVQWGLEGKSANVVLDEININNLKAVYHGDNMTFNLSCKRAVYNKKTQQIELKDDIVGKSSDGGELVTDYAKWDAETEEITTDSFVVVKRQNVVCRGWGLLTKPQLKWVAYNREIEVDFGQDKKITCNGPFEIDYEKNVAIFNNNVKIADKDSEMFTDKLTVYLNPATNEVEHVITEGNVKVVHRGNIEDIGNIGKVSF